MENSEWDHFTKNGKEELNGFLDEINNRNPPEPNELICLLQRETKFHFWMKKTKEKSPDENMKWQWLGKVVSQVAFNKVVEKNRENIIPIGFNNNQNIWYLERVKKEVN